MLQELPSRKAQAVASNWKHKKQISMVKINHCFPHCVQYFTELNYLLLEQHSFFVLSPETLTSKYRHRHKNPIRGGLTVLTLLPFQRKQE